MARVVEDQEEKEEEEEKRAWNSDVHSDVDARTGNGSLQRCANRVLGSYKYVV